MAPDRHVVGNAPRRFQDHNKTPNQGAENQASQSQTACLIFPVLQHDLKKGDVPITQYSKLSVFFSPPHPRGCPSLHSEKPLRSRGSRSPQRTPPNRSGALGVCEFCGGYPMPWSGAVVECPVRQCRDRWPPPSRDRAMRSVVWRGRLNHAASCRNGRISFGNAAMRFFQLQRYSSCKRVQHRPGISAMGSNRPDAVRWRSGRSPT